MKPLKVISDHIDNIIYDDDGKLTMQLKNGDTHIYRDIAPKEYEALLNDKSFDKHFKDNFATKRNVFKHRIGCADDQAVKERTAKMEQDAKDFQAKLKMRPHTKAAR